MSADVYMTVCLDVVTRQKCFDHHNTVWCINADIIIIKINRLFEGVYNVF